MKLRVKLYGPDDELQAESVYDSGRSSDGIDLIVWLAREAYIRNPDPVQVTVQMEDGS